MHLQLGKNGFSVSRTTQTSQQRHMLWVLSPCYFPRIICWEFIDSHMQLDPCCRKAGLLPGSMDERSSSWLWKPDRGSSGSQLRFPEELEYDCHLFSLGHGCSSRHNIQDPPTCGIKCRSIFSDPATLFTPGPAECPGLGKVGLISLVDVTANRHVEPRNVSSKKKQ